LAGVSGALDGTGSAARFNQPCDVAVDAAGNIYVADAYNFAIRKVTSSGVVSTLAGSLGTSGNSDGSGYAARFIHPWGITIDATGSLHVADSGGHAIRKVTSSGVVTTFAGMMGTSGAVNGTGTCARLFEPCGLAFDASGNLIFADRSNHAIRKISPSGVVTTLAGVLCSAGSGDGQASSAQFRAPSGVAIDPQGNIFIGDWQNQCLRVIR
jgi:sugar lactone lactonase YvrE